MISPTIKVTGYDSNYKLVKVTRTNSVTYARRSCYDALSTGAAKYVTIKSATGQSEYVWRAKDKVAVERTFLNPDTIKSEEM